MSLVSGAPRAVKFSCMMSSPLRRFAGSALTISRPIGLPPVPWDHITQKQPRILGNTKSVHKWMADKTVKQPDHRGKGPIVRRHGYLIDICDLALIGLEATKLLLPEE